MPYKAKATVFFNNTSYTCSVINLSRKGALLTSPVEAEPGAFLRLNLRLPGMDELIDLDAIMVRESADQKDTWAISFCQVSDKACNQLGDYIEGILTRHQERQALEAEAREESRHLEEAAKKKAAKKKVSVSASVSSSGDWQDWKSLQAAVEDRMKKVKEKVTPAKGTSKPDAERTERKKTHDEFEESLGSLDDIYRDALKDLQRKKKPKRR